METYVARQDTEGLWYVDGQGLPGFYGFPLYPDRLIRLSDWVDKTYSKFKKR